MNPRTRRAALYVIGAIAILASIDALAHSYTGLYGWALHHRLGGWQAMSWPAEIDVFLIVGELALYVAYLDAWERRYKLWPWVTAITGLGISVAGNVGHVQALPGSPVTLADRLTAATSPLAAFAGLMVGLLVLKMTREVAPARGPSGEVKLPPWLLPADEPFTDAPQVDGAPAVAELPDPSSAREDMRLLADAAEILGAARICGERVSQRALAAQLRERGHRFSNAQLRGIATTADSVAERRAALHDAVRLQRMSSSPSPGPLQMVSEHFGVSCVFPRQSEMDTDIWPTLPTARANASTSSSSAPPRIALGNPRLVCGLATQGVD